MAEAEAPVGLSRAEVLAGLEGDEGLLEEVAGLFLAGYPELRDHVRQAAREGNGDALVRAVHTLKGAASNFGMSAVGAAAERLELVGRTGDFGNAGAALTALELEMAKVLPALAEWARAESPT